MEYIIELLHNYRYYILFPLVIVEGPIVTVIAGFLCNAGIFNVFIVFPIIVLGDLIGDSIYYALGYWGSSGWLQKLTIRLGLTQKRQQRITLYIANNSFKTILLSKLILGIGVSGLFLAGKSRLPYGRFIKICLLTSLLQCSFYLAVGWFFGTFYQTISRYLDIVASISILIVLVFLLFYFIRSKTKKLKNHLEGE